MLSRQRARKAVLITSAAALLLAGCSGGATEAPPAAPDCGGDFATSWPHELPDVGFTPLEDARLTLACFQQGTIYNADGSALSPLDANERGKWQVISTTPAAGSLIDRDEQVGYTVAEASSAS